MKLASSLPVDVVATRNAFRVGVKTCPPFEHFLNIKGAGRSNVTRRFKENEVLHRFHRFHSNDSICRLFFFEFKLDPAKINSANKFPFGATSTYHNDKQSWAGANFFVENSEHGSL